MIERAINAFWGALESVSGAATALLVSYVVAVILSAIITQGIK